jgi:hypothetical protein
MRQESGEAQQAAGGFRCGPSLNKRASGYDEVMTGHSTIDFDAGQSANCGIDAKFAGHLCMQFLNDMTISSTRAVPVRETLRRHLRSDAIEPLSPSFASC